MTTEDERYMHELDDLVGWLAGAGFETTLIGDSVGEVDIVLCVRYRKDFLDVVHMRGPDRAEAARVPHDVLANIYEPHHVVWHYYGRAVATLSAMRQVVDLDGQVPLSQPYLPPRKGHPRPLKITDVERARLIPTGAHPALLVS